LEEFNKFTSKLEDLGELEVRERFSHGSWTNRNKSYTEEWLRRKDEDRVEARANLRDAREEETLSISKESKEIASSALEISKRDLAIAKKASKVAERQAQYAMYAAVIAVVALLVSNIDIITSTVIGIIKP